jgi:hypothetical protein
VFNVLRSLLYEKSLKKPTDKESFNFTTKRLKSYPTLKIWKAK